MHVRVAVINVLTGVSFCLGGCVSTGAYKSKEQEAVTLSKDLQEAKTGFSDLQEKYDKLIAENAEVTSKQAKLASENTELKDLITNLNLKSKRLSGEIEGLKAENEKLAVDNNTENLFKKIADRVAEQQQKVDKLQKENESLKAAVEKFTVQSASKVKQEMPEPSDKK